ncbi:hypothetical protein [Anaeromassilibacillus sp. SJQ-1]|uniref:hypothetical protein n=1 Tax=Anaeromassilibacillus sp. SJQ-1 TaxID=3375419 RepID=UPI003989C756
MDNSIMQHWALGILLLLLPTVFERAYNLSPVYQFHFLAYCFLFFSYVIGLVMQAYHFIPLYDKIMHTLSGTLGMFLGVLLFYLCKDKQEFQKQDYPLVAITSFSVSMAIAGLWEIGEYLISLFFLATHSASQKPAYPTPCRTSSYA